MIGERFHQLVVIAEAGSRNWKRMWLCRCDCGNTTTVDTAKLRSGNTKSCGCLKRIGKRPAGIATGERYGRLTVGPQVGKDKHRNRLWLCYCDCGGEITAPSTQIRRISRSCGCIAREKVIERSTTHGLSGTSEYAVWCRMISRCENPNVDRFPHYGGRGITICNRWRNDFAAFYEDMGPKPSPEHSIDRIDVNGNYEPGNCRWATDGEQARNRRRKLTPTQVADIRARLGPRGSVGALAREFGVSQSMVSRIKSGKH